MESATLPSLIGLEDDVYGSKVIGPTPNSRDLAMDHLPNESSENTMGIRLNYPRSRGINYLIIMKLRFDPLDSKTRIDTSTIHEVIERFEDSFESKLLNY